MTTTTTTTTKTFKQTFQTLQTIKKNQQTTTPKPKIPISQFDRPQTSTETTNTKKVKLCNFKAWRTSKKPTFEEKLFLNDDNNTEIPKEELENYLTDLLIELKQPIDNETKATIDFSSLNDSPEELYQVFSHIYPPSIQQPKPPKVTITRKPPKTDALKFLGGNKKPTIEPIKEDEVIRTDMVQESDSDRDEEEETIETPMKLVKIIETHEKHFPTRTRKSKIVELVQEIALNEGCSSIFLEGPLGQTIEKRNKSKNPNPTNKKQRSNQSAATKKDIPYAANKLSHLKAPTKIVSKELFDPFPKELPNYSAVNRTYKTKFYERKTWPPENRDEGYRMVIPLHQSDFCTFIKSHWNTTTLKHISPSSTGGIFQSQCVTLHESCVILNIAFHVLKSKIPNESPINRVFNFLLSYQTNLVKKVGEQRMVIRNTMHKLPPPRQVKNGQATEEVPLTFIELGKRNNLVDYIKKMIIPKYANNRNPRIPKLPNTIDITKFYPDSPDSKSKIIEQNLCIKHADSFHKMLVVSAYMMLAFLPTKDNRGCERENYWHEEPIRIPNLVNACNFILTFFNMREYLNLIPDYINGESVIKAMKSSFDVTDYIHEDKWQSYINQKMIEIINESFMCESLLNVITEDDIFVMLTPITDDLQTSQKYQDCMNDKDDIMLAFCETRFAGYMIIVLKNYKNRRKSEDHKECKKPKASKRDREEYLVCEGTPLENLMSEKAKELSKYFKKRKYKHYGQLPPDQKPL